MQIHISNVDEARQMANSAGFDSVDRVREPSDQERG